MNKDFEAAIAITIQYEVGPWFKPNHPACISGIVVSKSDRVATGDVNIPGDTGGHTRYGIAQNANPNVDVKTLTYANAKEIYFVKYWDKTECDLLPALINTLHFDACVNHGGSTAAKFIQRAAKITADGNIGPKTLSSVSSLCKTKEETKAFAMRCLDERERFFKAIVANNPSQLKFLNGWLNRVKLLREYVTKF